LCHTRRWLAVGGKATACAAAGQGVVGVGRPSGTASRRSGSGGAA
jgi:hypothetical protein